MADFAEVDVTTWPFDDVEPLGTKPKQWVVDPRGQRWLMKEATFNRRADGTRFRKGDDWAERIATELADQLQLPAARTELAFRDQGGSPAYGVISLIVVTDQESLVHGNELLAEVDVVGASSHDRTGYTLGAVRAALANVSPPADGPPGFTAWDCFAGYLVLDALLGNTDRHQENWAVIANGGRRLAPTFDHASSLGFQLDDAKREFHLTSTDQGATVEAYADRAKSKFEGSPSPIKIAAQALSSTVAAVQRTWLDRCRAVGPIEEIVGRIPSHRMTLPAREFAIRLVARNRSQFLSHPLATL